MLEQFCNFDEYCKEFWKRTDTYCERVNMSIPPDFCHFKCLGHWQRQRKEDAEKERLKRRPELTEEQKADNRLVSVIIPSVKADSEYLERTIKSVRDNAVGPVEVIVITDGFEGTYGDINIEEEKIVGQRVATNEAVSESRGEFIFRLDAHCGMSEGWDVRMKSSCEDRTVVSCMFDGLDKETWMGKNRDSGFVRIAPNAKSLFVRGWKSFDEREIEEETMGLSGTAFMMTKKYYNDMGGHGEELGGYGGVGSEWALKTWLTGGRCLLRTDVVCYHLWRKVTPFEIPLGEDRRAYDELYKRWIKGEDPRIIKPMGWLVNKFSPILNKRIYSNI